LAAPHTPVLLEEVLEWLRIRLAGTSSTPRWEQAALGSNRAEIDLWTADQLDRDAQALSWRGSGQDLWAKVTLMHAPFRGLGVAQELGIRGWTGSWPTWEVSSMQLDRATGIFVSRAARWTCHDMQRRIDGRRDCDRWSEKEIADLLYREADDTIPEGRQGDRKSRPLRIRALATTVAGPESNGEGRDCIPTKTFLALADSGESRDGGTRAVSSRTPAQ